MMNAFFDFTVDDQSLLKPERAAKGSGN